MKKKNQNQNQTPKTALYLGTKLQRTQKPKKLKPKNLNIPVLQIIFHILGRVNNTGTLLLPDVYHVKKKKLG